MTEEEKTALKALRKEIDEWTKENLAGKEVFLTALNKIVEFRYRNVASYILHHQYNCNILTAFAGENTCKGEVFTN